MNTCKKYACHRVYGAGKIYNSRSVVFLDDKGKVMKCASLVEETAATEWIGGVIVLSAKTELEPQRDFPSLLHYLTDLEPGHGSYAWHITPFDFEREDLTAQSIVRRL